MPRTTKLACGGKGPCCHIGYSHRHCEHCDMVIDTRPANWWYTPFVQPLQLYQPYWWTNGTYNNFGDVANGRPQTANSFTFVKLNAAAAAAADTSYNAQSLPAPTVAHVCEVK